MKFILILFVFIPPIDPLELKKLSTCQTALGMQSGSIPDSALSASSSFDINTTGPKSSRARTEQNGGAWCPLNKITSTPNEWLEINFGNLTYLTQVETQGRFNNGLGKEYAEYYILMYTRYQNDNLWIEHKPKYDPNNNSTWIKANHNTYIGEIRLLDPPIVARRLRFYPVSKRTQMICMRVEIYGCPFSDGIVSYSMSQGRYDVNSFGDDTYDGVYLPSTNMLINGLGQLSDGITGSEDINIINGRQPWIGWSNETIRYVTIKFEFDSIRQINRIKIHTNNLFSKDILIFKTAIISFSIINDEKNYTNVIIYQHNRDDIFEIARPILIELNNRIGKYVRLDLYFDSKWLLISEITFDSQIYLENISNNEKRTEQKFNRINSNLYKYHPKLLQTTPSTKITIELSFAFITGILFSTVILLIITLVCIVQRKKKLKFFKLTEKQTINSSYCTYPTLPIREFHNLNRLNENSFIEYEYTAPDVNVYSTFSPKHNLYNSRLLRTLNTNSCLEQSCSIEGTCGNSLMISINDAIDNQQISIKEINEQNITIIENIGYGTYGRIDLAEIQTNIYNNEKKYIIIKSLNDNVDNTQKTLFSKEIKLLSMINNPNLCSLLGRLNNQRMSFVFEYYKLDLYQYLRQQTIPLINSVASDFIITLAYQIASAMTYLSSFEIIHRDLAARNCLISLNSRQIYVTDIAMIKSEYLNDYARVGPNQIPIPIRWTAWEAIFLNKYSLKSDIWSFGVTLYELFTYARQRPYHALTNEQFLQYFASQSSLSNYYLPQPELCSENIYEMMCECWQFDSGRRPSFTDICTFLLENLSNSSSSIQTTLNKKHNK